MSLRGHPYITSSKGLGGPRKWPFLLTFSTAIMLIKGVGRVQKGQKYTDVVKGWPLRRKMGRKVGPSFSLKILSTFCVSNKRGISL